ncbi:hypothetical protein SKAU_G00323320 [Synaphobranchus kaupii]|uniref:Hexosyltransferase n=1 Tax=Synaphobranchus kaupii TaxID=118154 RepID=A0A9Q1IK41_SYNKA|nr:hypothetical protein SKAU_G00323320 [Synaphobranchus kaupii]
MKITRSTEELKVVLLQTADHTHSLPHLFHTPFESTLTMVPRRFKRNSVMVSVAFTCSLILICILSSFKMEHSSTKAQAAQAKREIELETNAIPKVNPVVPAEKKNASSLEPRKELKLIEISGAFRQAIPQNGGYWNRKQHSLFKQLDSGVRPEGNATEPNRTLCSPASSELLHTNVQDFDSYPPLYQDFLRGMHCRDPSILIDQPNKCSGTDGDGQPFLLFAIKSLPRNFEQRQALRETWGREVTYDGGLKVRTVFLLGTSSPADPDLGQLLHFEARHYGDVLQWDFRDTFYNLTLKENAFLGWALRRCAGASFIFKGDDDVFVNPWAMIDYLRSLEPGKASRLYAGQIVYKASPFRDTKSKYYVPQTFYEGPYPSYAGGGGFLFSGSLVRPLHQLSRHIAHFPIDDVYTGMCFQALGVTPVAHPGFQTFDIREQDRENACAHKGLLLVHKRTPQQVLRLWRYMLSPLLTC